MMLDQSNWETPTADAREALLDEYLELKAKIAPVEKRLEQVRDRLREIVTEHGHFVDEVRAVMVRVEPRFRKEYDADRLATAFPQLSSCIKPAVDVAQLESCLRAGMVTERELEGAGVLVRTLHSRALLVKPIPASSRYASEDGDVDPPS